MLAHKRAQMSVYFHDNIFPSILSSPSHTLISNLYNATGDRSTRSRSIKIPRPTRSSKDVSGRLIGVVPTTVLVPYFPPPLIQPITVPTLSKVWLSETRWNFYTIHAQPPLSVSRNLKYRRHPTATRTPRVTLMWYCSSVLPHNNKLNITKNVCTNMLVISVNIKFYPIFSETKTT